MQAPLDDIVVANAVFLFLVVLHSIVSVYPACIHVCIMYVSMYSVLCMYAFHSPSLFFSQYDRPVEILESSVRIRFWLF